MLALVLTTALAARPPELTVTVTDAAGAPVGYAAVVVPAEHERHLVNHTAGTWAASVLYPPDGHLPLVRGATLTVVVGAPGYASVSREVTLDGRRVAVTVPIDRAALPVLPCLPEGLDPAADPAAVATWASEQLGVREERDAATAACLLAARSTGAFLAWEGAARARITDPTEEAARAEAAAQRAALEAARAWVEDGRDDPVADALCLASDPYYAACR